MATSRTRIIPTWKTYVVDEKNVNLSISAVFHGKRCGYSVWLFASRKDLQFRVQTLNALRLALNIAKIFRKIIILIFKKKTKTKKGRQLLFVAWTIACLHTFDREQVDHVVFGTRKRAELAIAHLEIAILGDTTLTVATNAILVVVDCGRTPPFVILSLTCLDALCVVYEWEIARCTVRIATSCFNLTRVKIIK